MTRTSTASDDLAERPSWVVSSAHGASHGRLVDMTKYQVWSRQGSTFPDTSATDQPFKLGPEHASEAEALEWMADSGYQDTGNREYYATFWVEEVGEGGAPSPEDASTRSHP